MEKATNFMECATCAAKPGMPALCPACVNNRELIVDLQARLRQIGPAIFTEEKPTKAGWYWCRAYSEQEKLLWVGVCRIDRTLSGLEVSWMTEPGKAATLPEKEWNPKAQWCGPLPFPIEIME